MHTDVSKAEEMAGRKSTLISAGRYKVEGNPLEPLGDDAKAHMQARVDEYHGAFVRAVAKHRRVSVDTVRNGFGQGRTVGAQAAMAAGMVDGIATLNEVVGRYAHRTLDRANRPVAISPAKARSDSENRSVALANARIAIAAAHAK